MLSRAHVTYEKELGELAERVTDDDEGDTAPGLGVVGTGPLTSALMERRASGMVDCGGRGSRYGDGWMNEQESVEQESAIERVEQKG